MFVKVLFTSLTANGNYFLFTRGGCRGYHSSIKERKKVQHLFCWSLTGTYKMIPWCLIKQTDWYFQERNSIVNFWRFVLPTPFQDFQNWSKFLNAPYLPQVRCHISLLKRVEDSHFSTLKWIEIPPPWKLWLVSAGINQAGCQEWHLSPDSGKVLMLQSVKRNCQCRGLSLWKGMWKIKIRIFESSLCL